jgi:tetratricopeptide (TPR) repeat protein
MEALTMMQRLFKDDNEDLARSYHNCGSIYRESGENEEALKYCLLALSMRQRLFKIDHEDISISLNNIGLIYKGI